MPHDEPWQRLLHQATGLIEDASARISTPIPWSLGGGTVLMLRLNHRRSKDIDAFLPDPQYLGLFNPRMSDAAQSLTSDYDESAGHVKLFLPEGEIDFVVAAPLTDEPFEDAFVDGLSVRLERSAEIIAKKFWHRGNLATARDLFDLAAVSQSDPEAITTAMPFLTRHAEAFLAQLDSRQAVLGAEFAAIDALDFTLTYDECVSLARDILGN